MDLARKLGIGIVMIIPTFVISGLLWELIHSWVAVLIWVVIMGFLYAGVITGKFTGIRKPPMSSQTGGGLKETVRFSGSSH